MFQLLTLVALCVGVAFSGDSDSVFGSRARSSIVSKHNAARRSFGVPTLRWSNALAQNAKNWGKDLNCRMQHTPANMRNKAMDIPGLEEKPSEIKWANFAYGQYGENLATLYTDEASQAEMVDHAMNGWLAERKYFTLSSNSCRSGKQCGHYTQAVWKETKLVGCSYHTCSWGRSIAICQYYPAGNFVDMAPKGGQRKGYGDSQYFGLELENKTVMMLFGATLFNTLLIVAIVLCRNKGKSSFGYQKQLAQTDYDTEEEQLNGQVV